MSLRSEMKSMTRYEIHNAFINQYILRNRGNTTYLNRKRSEHRNDYDVLRDNHRFLWDDKAPDTWEARFAKKYYDKLFKEYCIGDLSRYKENKIALRWRTEQEVILGKGQFICGNKLCSLKAELKTWEVNFAYREHDEKKNALVKICLCRNCSAKFNYRTKNQIKRLSSDGRSVGKSSKKHHKEKEDGDVLLNKVDASKAENEDASTSFDQPILSESPWEKEKPVNEKSRDEEMEDYLQYLLL